MSGTSIEFENDPKLAVHYLFNSGHFRYAHEVDVEHAIDSEREHSSNEALNNIARRNRLEILATIIAVNHEITKSWDERLLRRSLSRAALEEIHALRMASIDHLLKQRTPLSRNR